MSGILYIIGAGGHAKVVSEAALQQGLNSIFINEGSSSDERNVSEAIFLANPSKFLEGQKGLICGIGSVGSMKIRQTVLKKYVSHSQKFLNLTHPSSVVASDVQLGCGIFIAQGVQLVTGVRIGDHAIVNTAAVLDHDTLVGEGSHIGPGAILCGGIRCGNWVHVGSGSVIIQGRRIADGVVVGAGSVVTRDILEPNSTWVGVPARRIR